MGGTLAHTLVVELCETFFKIRARLWQLFFHRQIQISLCSFMQRTFLHGTLQQQQLPLPAL